MKRISTLVTAGAFSILTGCMNLVIEGDCPKTQDSKFGSETIHGSYFGFNWDDDSREVRKADDGLGLAKVEYRSNFFYALVSVFSAGLYAPVDIDYWIESPQTITRLPKKN
ncbi:MAG: hypothetical protein MUC65_02175 [Pontiellaceae bacterium]|nr:hypothetical protein [Pontiellaceae bacterium]